MKRAICFLLGHDWVESPTLTTFLAYAWKGAGIVIYKCRRCGEPGFH